MTEPKDPPGCPGGEAQAPRRTNHYRRGRQLEWDVAAALKASGYRTLRTAGSKGAVDVLAFKPGVVLLIQAKISGHLPAKEWNAAFDLAAVLPGLVPLLVERDRGLRFWRLTDRKTRRGIYPMEPFTI